MSKTHLEEREKEPEGPFTQKRGSIYDGRNVLVVTCVGINAADTVCALLNTKHRSGIGEEDFEFCAHLEHERWARWQEYVHSCCARNNDGSLTIPANLVAKWGKQIATPYSELSEHEKEADRREVGEYAHLLRSHPTTPNAPSSEVIEKLVEALKELLSVSIKIPTHTSGWIITRLLDNDTIGNMALTAVHKAQSALALIDAEKK